jgi:mRNA interferase MazF
MNVGEVHWVEFPAGAGRAQAGRRPAVVVQSARMSARLPTLLMVPLTTQRDALRFPGTVLLEPDGGNRLTHVSVALVFQLTTVDKRFLAGLVGKVSQSAIEAIWSALDELTGRQPAL